MQQVVQAFVAAFRAIWFWLRNLHVLLKLVWFPLLVPSIAAWGWQYWRSSVDIANAEARTAAIDGEPVPYIDPPPAIDSDLMIVIWASLQLLSISAAAVAVHRFVVLGERRSGELFAFPFGRPERAYFGMGLIAFVLMLMLIAGQFMAQLELPTLDLSFVNSVVKPYAELGPWVLSMFLFPGELAIFGMPPLNYALWCALVIAAAAIMIRIAPWPAAVSVRENLALAETLSLTRGRPLTMLAFLCGIAVAAGLVFFILSVAGLSWLAASPESLANGLQAMQQATPPSTGNVEVDALLAERRLALYMEAMRYLSGLIGVTLGATLISHLYLVLKDQSETAL